MTRQLFFIFTLLPSLCFAGVDARMLYIKAVKDFSTCGNALMPWGNKAWQPDEVERPYVLQSKINRTKMQAEIDADFYSEANLQKLFITLTDDFYDKTSDITASLKEIPAEDHSVIWNSLFEIEQDARLIRDKLASDFRLHAEIIKMCSDDVNERIN